MNLVCRIRKVKVSRETRTNLAGHVYPNLLNRDFNALLPNTKWVMDLSELKVEHEKIFISAIVDLFNRELIAVVLGARPSYELVEATLAMAMVERKLEKMTGILLHTDRGSQFTSNEHHKQSKALEFIPSMSRKANCWDNAVMESVFSHYKTEFELHYPMHNYTQVKIDLLLFRVYFNEERSQKRLGFKTPKAFLEAHLQTQKQ